MGLLKHDESEVRCEACRILKEIGTAASEAALQTAAQEGERAVSLLAKEALAAIAKRK
jgi:HEAT repeat protein